VVATALLTMDDLEVAFIVFSALAAFLSGLVLLTVMVFPDMQKRLFMNIILWISASNLCASIASAWGFPNAGTGLCSAQAFAVPFFYKASWLWTTVLSYNIWKIAFRGVSEIRMYYAHLLCWGISLVTTVVPLITNDYGREHDDIDAELSWCSLTGDKLSAGLWILFMFNILLLAVFVANIYIQAKIYWDAKLRADSRNLFAVLNVIILYPPGFLVTWGPNLIFSILVNFGVSGNAEAISDVFNAVSILATQSGTVFAIIFFLKCKEARVRWTNLILSLFCGALGEPSDLTMAITTINQRATDDDVQKIMRNPSELSEFENEDVEYRITLEKQLAKMRNEMGVIAETTSSLYNDDQPFAGRESGVSTVRPSHASVPQGQRSSRVSFMSNGVRESVSGQMKILEEASNSSRGSLNASLNASASFPRVHSNAESEVSTGDEPGWSNYSSNML
jgi:hypothetical protein